MFALAAPNDVTTANHEVPQARPGQKCRIWDSTLGFRHFMYVKFDNGTANVAAANGGLCYFTDFDAYTVTRDVSDSAADANGVAGIMMSAVTDGYYTWIQRGGLHTAVITNGDDDIAAGDAVIASAAGDGTADSTAQDTAPVRRLLGIAYEADVDAANTVATMLTLDPVG